MEIEKNLLYTMLRLFWIIDNNQLCKDVSIIALQKMGFSETEINDLITDINIENIDEANEALEEGIKETKIYYQI